MSGIENLVRSAILELIAERAEPAAITTEMRLVNDLGLASLDIAALVAELEISTGKDPFSADTSITTVRTVGDLIAAYERA